jgi:hypothetical protein
MFLFQLRAGARARTHTYSLFCILTEQSEKYVKHNLLFLTILKLHKVLWSTILL